MQHGARPLRSTRRLANLTGQRPGWYKITNTASGPTHVSIYDEIGYFAVSAADFAADLKNITGDIELHINSPGGDVFDGVAIFNTLKQRPGEISVVIDGIAASAASFIAQAASPGKLKMAPHSQMMIHDGFGMGIGNAADMRELADLLDRASDNIAGIYADRTGKPVAYWRGKMKAETWYSDAEAVADGLADGILGQDSAPSNDWDLTVFAKYAEPAADAPGPGPESGDAGPEPAAPEPAAVVNRATPFPILAAAVDNSPWDASRAWHNGAESDDPAAFYKGICAGRKAGDPANQDAWALPYKYHPGDAPNAAGVRNALARLSSTEGLTNAGEARSLLERLMKQISPDYSPDDHIDTALLAEMFSLGLEGAAT